ncbi:amidohydrolase [Salinicola aestuarinus]|uniref:amidohydrolase n=1 Tax=Salinicola aestuarinus TaxID=1949082 RepID=UPI000DA128B9|nr:amidohydrolase [Salinicola aestuarinus]
MSDLRISLVQTDLHWEDPGANREKMEGCLGELGDGQTDLIVLPEMFATGFTMRPERFAEPAGDGPTLEWMKAQAAARGCVITGSLAVDDGRRCYNRLYWVTPDRAVTHYDKRHLFRMGEEPTHYTAGSDRVVVTLNGFRILLSICYDLRFPVWLRQQPISGAPFEYDVLLCVANWPGARRRPWRTLLQARAVENLSYVVGVNRIGDDGNGLQYTGDSLLVDFKGEPLIDGEAGGAFVETATLSINCLNRFRDKFPAWQDADRFQLDKS